MKDGTLTHLLPAARKQAELGNDERILELLRDRWIDYPRATEALQQLERLYETPRRDRMPCLLLHWTSPMRCVRRLHAIGQIAPMWDRDYRNRGRKRTRAHATCSETP